MTANVNTGPGAAPGDMVIRDVADDDMEAVREIYSHHVLDGLASFEEVLPPPTSPK
jgi:phosphinothricin acetyltransferase